ncbi:MAG: tyrosine-type recombinase/integrase, partial [Bacillota bacterium]
MAYIRKTDSGNYEAFIDMGRDPGTGKRRRITKTFNTKRESKNWIAEKTHERDTGFGINFNKLSIKEYLKKWLQEYGKQNLSPTTYDGYEMIVNKHLIPALGALNLEELKPLHIVQYQNKKLRTGRKDGKSGGLSKKTVLQHHRVLNRALKQAVMWQLLSHNPMEAVSAPTPKQPDINFLTKQEIEELLEFAKEEDSWSYYFIYLAVNTGMRRGELLGLSWEHVDFNKQTIHVKQNLVRTKEEGMILKNPKNRSSRRIIKIESDDVKVLIKLKKIQNKNKLLFGPEYNNKHNLIFAKANGERLYPNTATKRFSNLVKKLNFENVRLHDLRHSHATLMLQAGVHP